jgi:hypothetical protein
MAVSVQIGCVLVLGYLGFLAVSIITVRYSSATPITPGLEIVDFSGLPPVAQRRFDQMDETIKAISFRPVFYLRHAASGNMTGYIRFYINDAARDTATYYVFLQKQVRRTYMKFYCEYQSDCRNGYTVITINGDRASIFKRGGNFVIQDCAGIDDPIRLYEMHEQKCIRLRIASEKLLPGQGRELEYILSALKKDLQTQVKNGYYVFDVAQDAYRLTWKGAVLFTLKIFHRSRWWDSGTALDERDANVHDASTASGSKN